LRLFGSKDEGYIFRDLLSSLHKQIDFYVTFNYIPITKKNWGVVFETTIPRMDSIADIHRLQDGEVDYSKRKDVYKYLSLLSKDNCKFINTLSKSAFDIQNKMLSSYPEFSDAIKNKIRIKHPPQRINLFDKKINNSETLNFIFVGNDFYRKGGAEVILAFDSLISDGVISPRNINLNIVGDINKKTNYVLGGFQDNDDFFEGIEKIIIENDYINHYSRLKNEDLMLLVSHQDVGLLPTWGDTYGYSVLEMQSWLVPVISTSVRALPEINLPSNIIDIPTNSFGEIVIVSESHKFQVRESIVEQLKKKIMSCYNDRTSIIISGKISVLNLKNKHDPEVYFQTLKNDIESNM
ncbi:glycosyltransferase, partial [Tatumella ptyseos]